jgi:hypothetical protein
MIRRPVRSRAELDALADNVSDEASFIAFMLALSEDFNAPSYRWENTSIDRFLEAAAAFGADRLTRDGDDADSNPWRRSADMLMAGTLYE